MSAQPARDQESTGAKSAAAKGAPSAEGGAGGCRELAIRSRFSGAVGGGDGRKVAKCLCKCGAKGRRKGGAKVAPCGEFLSGDWPFDKNKL